MPLLCGFEHGIIGPRGHNLARVVAAVPSELIRAALRFDVEGLQLGNAVQTLGLYNRSCAFVCL